MEARHVKRQSARHDVARSEPIAPLRLRLHRLQLDTLADNQAMLAAATGVGYRQEGLLRKSAWVNGAFSDEVILGLLAEEWRDQPPSSPGQ